MTKKSPIRIFITQEERAKLSHLAGDALETPNKLGAEYLTEMINAKYEKRIERDLSTNSATTR